jgi:hypothetical protein
MPGVQRLAEHAATSTRCPLATSPYRVAPLKQDRRVEAAAFFRHPLPIKADLHSCTMNGPEAACSLASDDAPGTSMAGLLGPGADAEPLVLGLINRQDRYLARRTCQARRRELGPRTTTLVLSEDKAGEAVLPSVDLASSFPALRTLVLR